MLKDALIIFSDCLRLKNDSHFYILCSQSHKAGESVPGLWFGNNVFSKA